jgi:ribose transport system ATP-binding protein
MEEEAMNTISRTEPATTLLEVQNLSKCLVGVQILKNINFSVRSGEVHALMGGNGAGKSTLIKCLSGYWGFEAGSVTVGGQPLEPNAGQIAFVQQDLGLVPSLSVSENISLSNGFETGLFQNIRWKEQADVVGALLSDLGHTDIHPESKVRDLNPVQRTIVAVARAAQSLRQGAKVLVLDEPTASLPVDEIDRLFGTLNRLRDTGLGMIYVSHHLSEVFELSDRISVLRGGGLVSTQKVSDATEDHIVEQMLGQKVQKAKTKKDALRLVETQPILSTKKLCGSRVIDVDLDLHPGEIVGLVGLQGAGCTELAELLFGAQIPIAGEIALNGKPIAFQHPADAMRAGICLITEDRHVNGSFLEHELSENMAASDIRRFFKAGWLSKKAEVAEASDHIERFGIVPQEADRKFAAFSGGNQQKAILAKWVRMAPKVLICDQPDIGVDIGAKQVIYRSLQEEAAKGASILIISNQYDDLESLCHRVLVMQSGRLVNELTGEDINEHNISVAALGGGAIASGAAQ